MAVYPDVLESETTGGIAGRIVALQDQLGRGALTTQERGEVGILIAGWRERLALLLWHEGMDSALWRVDIGGEG